MKDKRRKKTLLAGIFLISVLAVPLGIMASVPETPTLSFEGVELNVLEDGSAQMLFTVYVDNVRYSDGARFALDYNPEYLVPSNHETNVPLISSGQGVVNTSSFFKYNPDLYIVDGVPQDPYQDKAEEDKIDSNTLYMALWTKRDLKENCGLDVVAVGEDDERYFVFNSETEKVALGTLSFRITDLSLLPKLVEQFGSVRNQVDPTVEGKYLIRFLMPDPLPTWRNGPWAIGACLGSDFGSLTHQELDAQTPTITSQFLRPAQATFTFSFPETIISVAAAEADLTLDAYRAYTNGDAGDIALAMQKYSPMVTATYADGSRRNFVFPWKGCTVEGAYAPTGGDYNLQQIFYYYKDAADEAAHIKTAFAVPVHAHLKVTPIILQAVTADGLHKTYALGDNLVSDNGVRTAAQLQLPSQARLVTDVPASGATLTVPVPGWNPTKTGSKWPASGENMDTLLADESTDDKVIHWPTPDDATHWGEPVGDDTVADRRRGVYTFTMAESYGGADKAGFSQAELQGAFPWLTVDKATYPLENATRRLVGAGQLVDNSRYQVEYIETTADVNSNPVLKLQVTRTEAGNATLEDMSDKAQFRILLPDGTELGTGLTSGGKVGGTVNVDNWFVNSDINQGSYTAAKNSALGDYHNRVGYDLSTCPGSTDSDSGAFAAERERLRRYINLGGYFAVSINEDPVTYAWSDFIPVYVQPRANLHTADKEYNFIGDNAGLYGWPGVLGNTVTLPQGSYAPVDSLGQPTGTTERYGVPTTYDGSTGAEPGELNRFTITPSWSVSTTDATAITQYGPANFLDGARYTAYGTVGNPAPEKQAAIRTQAENPPAQATEKITLTYAGTTGVTTGTDGNVDLVTFDTRTQGYTIRQDYDLIITNVGDTDLYGLDVDTLTHTDDDGGGHFVLLKPPAAFLPAGSSTTFTLTYVYGLTASSSKPVDYRDTLYITSTSHPGGGSDYLLDFDAEFRVSADEIHRVTVKVEPSDGCMGSAGIIIGEVQKPGQTPEYVMDITAGTTAFRKGDMVYIMAAPEDEYAVKAYTCVDSSGAPITMNKYTADGDGSLPNRAKVPKGKTVYTFTMPDYDATVTIQFHEPIESKLRLSRLSVFADETADTLVPPAAGADDARPAYDVWQKRYTDAELAAAEAWAGTGKGTAEEYLMTCGAANKSGLTVPGVDETVEQYLVVLPYEVERPDGTTYRVDFAQVEVALRKVAYTLSGANPDIKPTVSMTLYNYSPVGAPPAGTTEPAQKLILDPPETGDTATESVHTSDPFAAPAPATSKYVRIDIAYKETTDTVTRSYFVELHREPKEVIAAFDYGNSPYGMIMNDPAIDGAEKDDKGLTAKDRAKAAFVDNGYSFHNLTTGVPSVVTNNGLAGLHYWTEAWVDVNAVYEPESGRGLGYYDRAANLDLSDTALFVELGKAFEDPGLLSALDSSGRPADISKATISVDVIKLDNTQTDQDKVFAGPDPGDAAAVAARTATLDLGDAGKVVAAGWEKDAGGTTLNLRPGLYALEYTFPDYDPTQSLTVTRPFVVLAPVGDVDGNVAVTIGSGSDEEVVKGRVTAPLGYTADYYPNAAIFKFRTCDVNNDRNINNIDANTIHATVKAGGAFQPFYLPTGYRPPAASEP